MRKLIVLIVIIAAATGGYWTYWHQKADAFKQMFIQSADNLNEQTKPLLKDLPFVRYDNVSVTGFPFSMVLEVSKPVANIPASALLKDPIQQVPYEWIEEISYGDKITLTGTIMGDHYTFTANGDRTHRSLVNRTARHTLVASSASPLVCNLGVEQPKGGTPWTMQPIFSDPKTFLNIFRSFDCNVEKTELKDNTGAMLLSSDGLSYSVVNTPADATTHKVALKMDYKNAKATPLFDAAYKDYMLMAYSISGKEKEIEGIPVSISEYGAQSFKMDAVYNGPTDPKHMDDPTMNMHFDVNALNFESSIYNLAFDVHFANMPQGNDRTITIGVHSHGESTEKYDAILQKSLTYLFATLGQPEGRDGLPPQFAKNIAAMGNPSDIAAAITPQSHTLGKTAFDFDLTVKGPNQKSQFIKQSNVALDNLNWVATPYGIKANGHGSMSVGGKMPSAELKINCISCDALITDAGNYAMRLEALADKASPSQKPYLSKGLIDGVKQFVHGIAEKNDAADLVIDFVMKDIGFTISGKQMPEVMALYMSTIAPQLPQLSPSAGGQPSVQ